MVLIFLPPCFVLAVKIDMESMMVTVDDQLEGCSVEDLAGELPEFSPRYIALRYLHRSRPNLISAHTHEPCSVAVHPATLSLMTTDVLATPSSLSTTRLRVRQPSQGNSVNLCRHNSPPPYPATSAGVKPEHNMIYAGTKTAVVNAVEISKVRWR